MCVAVRALEIVRVAATWVATAVAVAIAIAIARGSRSRVSGLGLRGVRTSARTKASVVHPSCVMY